MKSTSIKYAFLALCAAFALTGCRQEAFDEMTELPLTRCLVPMELSASVADGDQVTFSWKVTKDAQRYQLELSEDAAFTAPEEIVVAAAEVPKTLQLTVDKTYFWRVKAISDKLQESKYALPQKPSFDTYPVRPSLNPVIVSRETTAVSIAWDDATDKTDLTSVQAEPLVLKAGEEPLLVALSAADIAACTKKIEGLQAGREYKFTLLFGKAGVRGAVTACTRPEMGDGVVSVSTAAGLLSATDKAGAPVRVKLAYSADPIELKGVYPDPAAESITVNGDLYLYGESTEDGKKPVLRTANLKLATGATVLHLEDLSFDGAAVGSLIDNDNAALTAIEIVNCEVTGYKKGVYSVTDKATAAGTSCAMFLVEGCYMHDICADGSGGGDFIDIRNGVTNEVIVRNSTFYAAARTFLRLTNGAKAGTVLLENNTFNYVTTTPSSSNNRGIISVSVTTEVTSVIVRKNVFLNEYSDAESGKAAKDCWVRLCRSSNDSYRPDCDGNVYYNTGAGFFYSTGLPLGWKDGDEKPTNGEVFEPLAKNGATVLTEDPCVNSEAGKLYLNGKAGATIVSLKAGDPRWWNAVQPVVVRPTELTVVSADYTWDFTEKTIYDTEEITVPTIIGNARIFALPSVPAQVVMSDGVTFSQGAVLSGGVPQYSGVGILTSGCGSVKVTAIGTDATAEVVAGGDRYPVLADGKEHTVVLGDLAGENNIYVIADKELTLKKIVWTTDLTPEATKTALTKPNVTVTPNKLDEGTAEDVVVAWNAVANAADYVYTFAGAESILTETSLTIPAAEVAALTKGEYAITVKARPVATSTKWMESAVAEAKLTVNEVVAGATVTLTWDFSAAAWQNLFATKGTAGSDITNWNITLDGLLINSNSKSKYGTTYFQFGGKSGSMDRYFKFTAPAKGTLTITSSNGGGTADMARTVKVEVGEWSKAIAGGFSANAPEAIVFDNVPAGDVIITAPENGLRFYKIEFEYVPPIEYNWDFSAQEWQDLFATKGAAGNDITNWNITLDGLLINSNSKSKYGATYFQFGGKSGNMDRYFKFTIPEAGTITIKSSNGGESAAMDRTVKVEVGTSYSKAIAGGFGASVPEEIVFDGVPAGDVIVTAPENGLRFYTIHYINK